MNLRKTLAARDDKEINYGEGHRGRLRDRLLGNGGDALLDHEIIEFLLTLAIPRIDTKPIAKQLIAHYGSMSALFAADAESLIRQKGLGPRSAAAIKIVQAAALRMLSEPVANSRSWPVGNRCSTIYAPIWHI